MNVDKSKYKRGGKGKSFFVCTAKKKKKLFPWSVKPLEFQKCSVQIKPNMCIPRDLAIPLPGHIQ